MPNSFAYFVLFMWPIVVVVLFQKQKLPAALAWSIVAGYLLLPTKTEIDFPILPAFNKTFIPNFVAVVMCLITVSQIGIGQSISLSGLRQAQRLNHGVTILKGWLPRSKIGLVLVLMMLFSPIVTALLNNFPIIVGGLFIPGLTYYDALSIGMNAFVTLLPFLMARKFLADTESHNVLLKVLCVAGFLYVFLALFEVRMSPQLNVWIYGFFPHQFLQHIRAGGFRPVVFLHHGLWLGIFFSISFLAAAGLWRAMEGKPRGTIFFMASWIAMTLVLAKTFGALVITLVLTPIVLFFKMRMQMIFAALIAMTVLFYPMVRGVDILPLDGIVSLANKVSGERAGSLKFRLDNEDILLERANERPFFGWGGWGRSRVYDQDSGRDVSTTDGRWIIVLGQGGWIRYLAEFGLLAVPIILLAWRRKNLNLSFATSALCLALCANLVDMIPNSTFTPITLLIAGALMGRLEVETSEEREEVDIPVVNSQGTQYRRNLKPKISSTDKVPMRQRRI